MSLFYVFINIKLIDTNIYSLIDIENESVLLNMNKNLSSSVLFLFDNMSNIDTVSKLNNQYQIFQSINKGAASHYDSFINDMDLLKTASLKRSYLEDIENNTFTFFNNHIDTLLNSFTIKILPLEKDFFMLSSHSALLENGGSFKYDINNDVLYTTYDNKTYYMVQAVLYDKYNPGLLLDLVNDIKHSLKSGVIISGGALFNADGHRQGITESVYMTILSILLSAVILLTAFRQKSILYLMTTIIFSLTLGLAGCIFIFNTIHILSIIVSASLIGLVVDFSLHWLANNQNKMIKSSSIKIVIKYLIINFIITAVGYMLFMFSFMALLQQIAVISIITLFASLLYTIFFLPYMLNGACYTTSNIFNKIFKQYIKSIDFLMSYRLVVLLITAAVIIAGSIKLMITSDFEDNIKNYSSINNDFLNDTIMAGNITGMKNPSNYLVINNYTIDKENQLITSLLENNLINNYNGLSKVFLSETQQSALKYIFNKSKNDSSIINMYIDTGFDKNFIENEFNKASSFHIMDINEILNINTAAPFRYFYQNNQGIVFFENSKSYNDLIDNKTFNNILSLYNAKYYNLVEMINNYFSQIKKHAVILKIIGILAGFLILSLVFSLKKSLMISFAVLLSLLFSISIFSIFSIDINIFAVFGFILAGAVGIDYAVLMLNEGIDISDRYFGIFTSALTSMVSFIILTTSATYAVFTFGLSVALSLFIFLYILPLFAFYNKKAGITPHN